MTDTQTTETSRQRDETEERRTFAETLSEMLQRSLRTSDIFGTTRRGTTSREDLFGTTAQAGTSTQRGVTTAQEAAARQATTAQTGTQEALARLAGTTTGTTGTQQDVARQFAGFGDLPPELQSALLNSMFGLSDLARPTTPGTFPPEVLEAAIRPITQQYQETVIPGIRQRAASAGQLYGPRTDVLEERAGRDYLTQIGDVQAKLVPAAQQLQQQGTIGAGETLRGLAGTIFGAPAARETITGATRTAEQRAAEEARTATESRLGTEAGTSQATRSAEETRVAEEQRVAQQTQQRTAAEDVIQQQVQRATEQAIMESISRTVMEELMTRIASMTETGTTTETTQPGFLTALLSLGRLGLLGAGPMGPFGAGGALAKPAAGAGGLAAGETLTTALAGGGAFCWIAAALYGYGTEEFSLARRWIFDEWRGLLATMVRFLYRRFGQRVATQRWALQLLRPLFNLAVRKARR